MKGLSALFKIGFDRGQFHTTESLDEVSACVVLFGLMAEALPTMTMDSCVSFEYGCRYSTDFGCAPDVLRAPTCRHRLNSLPSEFCTSVAHLAFACNPRWLSRHIPELPVVRRLVVYRRCVQHFENAICAPLQHSIRSGHFSVCIPGLPSEFACVWSVGSSM